MCSSDSILGEILSPIFVKGSPFQCLPEQVKKADAEPPESLREGFQRLFGCEEAKKARNVVFIWVLDHPYVHLRGKGLPSTIINVEKTDQSIAKRWPPAKISKLVTNMCEPLPTADPVDWQALADHNANLSFYSRIIASRGPLHVCWANVAQLNEASNSTRANPLAWERLILRSYRNHYGCLPLKNRDG